MDSEAQGKENVVFYPIEAAQCPTNTVNATLQMPLHIEKGVELPCGPDLLSKNDNDVSQQDDGELYSPKMLRPNNDDTALPCCWTVAARDRLREDAHRVADVTPGLDTIQAAVSNHSSWVHTGRSNSSGDSSLLQQTDAVGAPRRGKVFPLHLMHRFSKASSLHEMTHPDIILVTPLQLAAKTLPITQVVQTEPNKSLSLDEHDKPPSVVYEARETTTDAQTVKRLPRNPSVTTNADSSQPISNTTRKRCRSRMMDSTTPLVMVNTTDGDTTTPQVLSARTRIVKKPSPSYATLTLSQSKRRKIKTHEDKTFAQKLHALLNTVSQTNPDVMEWTHNGEAFIIKKVRWIGFFFLVVVHLDSLLKLNIYI